MKQDIHPTWYPNARVMCQCGNTWETGATVEEIRTEICSACHPFYTGEQRIVDTEGRVDAFMNRLAKREQIKATKKSRKKDEEDLTPMNLRISELGVDKRSVTILEENGIVVVEDFINQLAEGGDDLILGYAGMGRQVLSDIKRKLRGRGYDIPSGETAETEAE